MTVARRVPVVVLSGGLGSGKTTLLNHLLRRGVGRVGVIVNDFGAVNVDALLVRGHVDARAEIGGGCLCCLSDPGELDDALSAMTAESLDLDVVVVEASGLAEPRSLARMVAATAVKGVRFGGVVEVIDAVAAAEAQDAGDDLPVAADHVRVASLLVVNKADRVATRADGEVRLARLEHALRSVAPATPLLRTSMGAIEAELIFDAADRPPPPGQLTLADVLAEDLAVAHGRPSAGSSDRSRSHDGHDHERYVSASLDVDRGVDPDALVTFLESRPPGLYRVKGEFVVPGRATAYVVHAVGGWFTIERARDATDGRTRLVAIGTGMDAAQVDADLCACLADQPPGPEALRRFDRYLA